MIYIPRTPEEESEMLAAAGAETFDDLLADVPPDLRYSGLLKLPAAVSEMEAKQRIRGLADRNMCSGRWACFAGAGAYDHYVPSIVDHLTSRAEFSTAYTPYQAEISQGTLQAIYEFQSLVTRLTGMEIANASLYDGATALAEAVLMAGAVNRRKQVVVSGCINPMRLEVLRSYLHSSGYRLEVTDPTAGWTDPDAVKPLVGADTCCVIAENPNFFGVIEDAAPIAEIAHADGALLVVGVDPISLGMLAPPGDYGADIVVGEGQAMGNPLNFGGPNLGFMAAGRQHIRRLPGRIVGRTVDKNGRPCFCLTLQTREQHIRRERATSNICTNQALVALRAAIYLCWLGREGLTELAGLCFSKACYARDALQAAGFQPLYHKPFFREFAIHVPGGARAMLEGLRKRCMVGGVALDRFYPDMADRLLVALTERRTRDEIDRLVGAMKDRARDQGGER